MVITALPVSELRCVCLDSILLRFINFPDRNVSSDLALVDGEK